MQPAFFYSRSYLLRLAGLAIAYAALAKLSLSFFSTNEIVSIVWPSSGVALAALLIGGKKYWPGVFIGAFAGNLMQGTTGEISIFIAAGNTLGALVGVWLLAHTHHFNLELTRPRHILWLSVMGALSTCVSALCGVTTLLVAEILTRETIAQNLLIWWQGDTLGIILVTPLILVWRHLPHGWLNRERVLETVACFGLAFLAGQIIFLGWFSDLFGTIARGFWIFLFVTWGAARFGRHGALLIITMTAIQMLLGMVLQVGGSTSNQVPVGLLNFWFYILALSVIGIVLSTILKNSRESEKKFLSLFQNAPVGFFHSLPTGKFLAANQFLATMLGYPSPEKLHADITHIGTQIYANPHIREQIVGAALKRNQWVQEETDLRRRDGSIITANIMMRKVTASADTDLYLEGFIQDITERKQSEMALTESERRFRFLNELSDETRDLVEPTEIMAAATRLLGVHLHASRCAYADVEIDGDHFTIQHDYTDGCASTVGYYRLGLFGSHAVSELQAGRTFVVNDVDADIISAEDRNMFNAVTIKAVICCPLIKQGVLRAMMAVHQTTARTWTTNEISMVEEIAERCWEIIERARAEKERNRIESELLITQTAIEKSQSAFFRLSSSGQVLYVNDYACQSLGYSREELLDMYIWEFDPDLPPETWPTMWEALRKTKVIKIETRHQRKDGTIFPVEVIGNVINSEGEEYSFTFVQNITERKATEESLRLAASVYDTSSEAIMITNASNEIIAVNPAFIKITGYVLEEVIGKNPSILKSSRHDETFYDAMWDEIHSTGYWQGEVWDQRKNGEIYPKWLTINTVFNENGSVQRRVAMFTDVSRKREAEELIWHQANFDTLTELPNRQMFHDRLDQDIKKANRAGHQLALMFIDLDRFKEINDTLGHDKGDALLKEAALRITNCVRETDTVARLGGDEFTVIMGELEDASNIDRVAQNILHKMTEPFQLGEDVAYISASIGITLYPVDATDIEILLKNADQAMYAAKNQGRNRYSYFTASMQQAVKSRVQIANDLRGALAASQFWVAYQPIIELATGAIYKAEALLRWQHPTQGLISPATFIPIAEDTGLIVDIGDWVFRNAAQQAKEWRTLLNPAFQISVNKSPVQFHNEKQSHMSWYDYLSQLSLPGQSIAVEITEGLLLDASTLVADRLLEFRDAGIQVSLDDFGTGYSALSYLKKFDIDYLKIDQSFTRNLAHGSDDMALCEAIIVMAHKLGMQVIAEGVETEEQKNLLTAAGCDYGQGYFFSKPLPAKDFMSRYPDFKH